MTVAVFVRTRLKSWQKQAPASVGSLLWAEPRPATFQLSPKPGYLVVRDADAKAVEDKSMSIEQWSGSGRVDEGHIARQGNRW